MRTSQQYVFKYSAEYGLTDAQTMYIESWGEPQCVLQLWPHSIHFLMYDSGIEIVVCSPTDNRAIVLPLAEGFWALKQEYEKVVRLLPKDGRWMNR